MKRGIFMARFLDPQSQGKQDWISYTEKRKQIQIDRQADIDNNVKIAERRAKEKEQQTVKK